MLNQLLGKGETGCVAESEQDPDGDTPSLEDVFSAGNSEELELAEPDYEPVNEPVKKAPKKARIKSKKVKSRSTRVVRQQKKSSKSIPIIATILLLGLGLGGWFIWQNYSSFQKQGLSENAGTSNEQDSSKTESKKSLSESVNEAEMVSSQALIPRLETPAYIPKVARPNIVFVCAEGISTDWLRAYKGKEATPNIERLAENGLLFKTAWMQPEAASTHASILSGQYPFRHGIYNQASSTGDFTPEKTWTARLAAKGWQCAFFGRWPFDNRLSSESFGFKVQENQPSSFMNFLSDNSAKPLVMYVNYPLNMTKGFAASVKDLDTFVGQLQLNLINKRLYKKTIFIFTADGASHQPGEFNFVSSKRPSGVKAPGEVRNNSKRVSNLGVAAPLIISAPFLIPKNGFYTRDLVDSSDFFSTMKDLCGLRISNHKIDGRSFVQTLSGDLNPLEKRSWIFSQSRNEKMIRDWSYIYYNDKKYYGLKYDPLQSHNLDKIRHNDKVAPGAKDRLKMLMKRIGS
ncbi:sulfatase-like hydrolase/transferase [Lentisphaera profundi]|uniref:Sulfatase-like hydrolase/transferase n=1 Tax=Lentisphaera profundi TaxID=1658616 RepID=A0ABY7VQM2_9BACT|nr:sulfatase-like hydrolase/transferase [Lentisphaera profundi]WDE96498.1 sulfatase-like hydrolase/transferase [Lentisphaera profundi]